ncbi:hypothetical protein GRI40_01580 [Altererythrobacter aerius]|uniref:Aspartate-semialdehyde dehydrogenase n=1 Tax=Tsuneonella aeria TaxID=1837929 RepID=A0A6I4TAY0_9SPHN|nr:hypothetical protein [Tsuneonella aeria]MXO73914.1 hypothetical protein [Tsuneonella aeria]
MFIGACGGPPARDEAPKAAGTAAATAVAPAAHQGVAILDTDGIAIGRAKANARFFPFGTPRDAVETSAERALAEPAVRSENAECGAGPMRFVRYGSLTLNFLDDRLAGWWAEPGRNSVTRDSIRPGMRLRDLAVGRSVKRVAESTLEGEFTYVSADGREIGGFADGAGENARIASLHAGANCFFR